MEARGAFTYLRYIAGVIFIRNSTQKTRENYSHMRPIASIIRSYPVYMCVYIYTYVHTFI